MKEGTGGDPFGDDPIDDQPPEDDPGPDTGATSAMTTTSTSAESKSGSASASGEDDDRDQNDDGLPWAVQRNSVKSGREMVQFYLREFVQERETDFKRDVEAETGYETYLTDVREAAYLVAMKHPEEVAELLDEWGCEYV
ncbi:hypothetical protein [Halorussus sp. AFM4]|uniref:hypothetical protein n=1 Tax=Halorussus sp. AFM4 TaxID=3421651 RepID=UPI003EB7B3CF